MSVVLPLSVLPLSVLPLSVLPLSSPVDEPLPLSSPVDEPLPLSSPVDEPLPLSSLVDEPLPLSSPFDASYNVWSINTTLPPTVYSGYSSAILERSEPFLYTVPMYDDSVK